MINKKYVADDYMNRTVVGKIHDAFEKQKQLAAQGKQKSSAASVPRPANKMAATAAAGVTAGAAQRGYTVTGLNSSEPAYRKALKQKTEKTPQSVVTAPQPPELPQPVPQPTPPAAPAASVAPTPVEEATPSPAKAEPAAKASILQNLRGALSQGLEQAQRAKANLHTAAKELRHEKSPAYTEKDLIPYTAVEESEYWEDMQKGKKAETAYGSRIGSHLAQKELYEKATELVRQRANAEDYEPTEVEQELLTQASHYNVWIGEPESMAAWEKRIAAEEAALAELYTVIDRGRRAETSAREAGYYFEPTEREKSEERLAKYRGDAKAWEQTMPTANASEAEWAAWEKEVREQNEHDRNDIDYYAGLRTYALKQGDKETAERIQEMIEELEENIRDRDYNLLVLNEDYEKYSQVQPELLDNQAYRAVNDIYQTQIDTSHDGRMMLTAIQRMNETESMQPYTQMTAQQKAIYNYLAYQDYVNGTKEAEAYHEFIGDQLDYQQAMEQTSKEVAWAQEHPVQAAVTAPLLSTTKWASFLATQIAALKGEEMSPYDPSQIPVRMQQNLQAGVASQLPEWAHGAYGIYNDVAEGLVALPLGPVGGTIMLGTSSGADQAYDVLQRGGSVRQAADAGIVGMGGEILPDVVPKITAKIPGVNSINRMWHIWEETAPLKARYAENALKSSATSVANLVQDTHSMKDNSNWVRSKVETGGTEEKMKELIKEIALDTLWRMTVDYTKTFGDTSAKTTSQRSKLPDARQERIRIMNVNDPAFAKYGRSITKYKKLLEGRDNMLMQLRRAQMSGDQEKIKEYTKGLNTLNKEIWYQENHNPMLNEAVRVQEYLFNGNRGEK